MKIGQSGKLVSLLLYPEFFDDEFPSLAKSTTVNTANESVKIRNYGLHGNPPILHKKELLLDLNDHRRRMFLLFTEQLEARSIKPNKPGLGFKKQWETYLGIMGVAVKNHRIMDI